jgi:hypothetical protein
VKEEGEKESGHTLGEKLEEKRNKRRKERGMGREGNVCD